MPYTLLGATSPAKSFRRVSRWRSPTERESQLFPWEVVPVPEARQAAGSGFPHHFGPSGAGPDKEEVSAPVLQEALHGTEHLAEAMREAGVARVHHDEILRTVAQLTPKRVFLLRHRPERPFTIPSAPAASPT